MTNMLTGIYHEDGPRKDLRFKRTLLMEDKDNKDNYLAQFDDMHLPESHGWHTFNKKLFINVVPIGIDK